MNMLAEQQSVSSLIKNEVKLLLVDFYFFYILSSEYESMSSLFAGSSAVRISDLK